MYRIAHISDLHIPPLPRMAPRELLGKRLLGLLSWHYKWQAEHRIGILDALRRTLAELEPDHICVTGDLTFTAHPQEVEQAARWLTGLGDAHRISLVPGNHDAYVRGASRRMLESWAPWMRDDERGGGGFPFLHRRGPIDIIGVSSAIATRTPRTVGRLGAAQLERTRQLLERLSGEARVRVLLIHHPPQDGAARPAKALLDRRALQALLAVSSVDLVLHGHLHRPVRARLRARRGPIPVLGASSGSARGQRYSPAHFHVLEIDPNASPPSMGLRDARYCPRQDTFLIGGTDAL